MRRSNSILAQTFTDFELIISDNASSDKTEEICREYAGRDSRIRYTRNATNIGGANNHNATFRLARGRYFRWAAHDDVCAPEFLDKCVAVLDADPSIAICFTQSTCMDENGSPTCLLSESKLNSLGPVERFKDLSRRDDLCEAIYGLIRSEVLGKTRLLQNYTESDRTLLSELSTYGRFYEIPEALFFKRIHPKNTYVNWRTRMAWYNTRLEGKIVFPNWMQFFDYFVTIRRMPLSQRDKLRCYLFMGPWFLMHWKQLGKDVAEAIYMLLHKPEWRKQRYIETNNWV